MATHTGSLFARLQREPAAHDLQGLSFRVQRLHRQGGIGGRLETGRTVRLNRHRAEHPFDVPATIVTEDPVQSALAAMGKIILKHAQRGHRAFGYPCQAAALIYVLQVHNPLAFGQIDTVGKYRWTRFFSQGNRFQKSIRILFRQRQHIVINIHQINTPGTVLPRFRGNEKLLVREGIGMQKVRPYAVHKSVPDNRRHRLTPTRNLLKHAVAFPPPVIRFNQQQPTAALCAMVARSDANHTARLSGQGPCIKKRIGKIDAAPPILALIRSVRVHMKQHAAVGMGRVRIFPALV
ncbi:MAG: hypothetical protein BWY09_01544 [Candidatus Hydrogenedentes bacterium ADurb.Bin179]|nr:MAG: hypothetical protein BWY09_01544 [Candidatus Hydrogenedentes bacterium ADurb.Bin179]